MIETIRDPQADIVEERGLFHIVVKSIGVVGHPIDFWIPLILCVGSVPISLVSEFYLHNLASVARMAKMLVTWSALGDTISATVLGFLIAGFAVFAAVTDKPLLAKLASYKSKGRKISQFKFIFFNFIYVFFAYFLFIVISSVLTVNSEENSPLWYVGKLLNSNFNQEIRTLMVVLICCYLAAFLHCLLILRGFIWNLYSSLVIAIFADEKVKNQLNELRMLSAEQGDMQNNSSHPDGALS